MNTPHYIVEALDTLDAAVFGGDAFQDPKNRDLLREHIARWQAELDNLSTLDQPS